MNGSTRQALDWPDLPNLFPEFGDSGRWIGLLRRHAELVEAWGERVGLTAVSPAEAVRRNYAESLETWRIAMATAPAAAADIGPGAGFPGLVAAVVSPGCRFHLIEPLRRRARFLKEAVTELGLGNVEVHDQRAESAGRGPLRDAMDVATARAVAPLRELLEYASPLVRPGGRLVLPKGSGARIEVADAETAAEALSVHLLGREPMRPEVSATPWCVVYEKRGPTPDRFPRRPGMPAKRPL